MKKVLATFISFTMLFTIATPINVLAASKLKKPKLSSATVSSTSSIKLKWKKVKGAGGYEIYQKTAKGKYKKIKTIKGNSTFAYKKSKLKIYTKYSYKIRAFKKSNSKKIYSKFSNVKTVRTKCKHNYEFYNIEKEATCNTVGICTLKCSFCKGTKKEVVPFTEHEWIEANCTTPKTCTACNTTIGKELGHSLTNYKCQHCNYVDEEQKIKDYNTYKDIVERQIKSIKAEGPLYYGTSTDFAQDTSELSSEISVVKRKIAALSGDYSSSAVAQRKRLEAEQASLQKELDELYAKKSRTNQVEALERELESYYNKLFG